MLLNHPQNPLGSYQVRRKPRSLRICRSLSFAVMGSSRPRVPSLQSLQIREQSLQIVAVQRIRRHPVARLNGLRIGESSPKVAPIIGQRAGGNRVTAREVSQIGSHTRACDRSANRVAHHARLSKKYLLTAWLHGDCGSGAGLSLLLLPA